MPGAASAENLCIVCVCVWDRGGVWRRERFPSLFLCTNGGNYIKYQFNYTQYSGISCLLFPSLSLLSLLWQHHSSSFSSGAFPKFSFRAAKVTLCTTKRENFGHQNGTCVTTATHHIGGWDFATFEKSPRSAISSPDCPTQKGLQL